MAFPILPLLALALGTGASFVGNRMAQNEAEEAAQREKAARDAELMEILQRNRQDADANYQTFQSRLSELQPMPQQIAQDEAATDRASPVQNAVMEFDDVDIPLSGSAPKIVQSQLANAMKDAWDKSTDHAQKMAKLGAYSDHWFNQGLATNEAARDIETRNRFARERTAMLPAMQDFAAYDAQKPRSGLGELLSGIGRTVAGAGGAYF